MTDLFLKVVFGERSQIYYNAEVCYIFLFKIVFPEQIVDIHLTQRFQRKSLTFNWFQDTKMFRNAGQKCALNHLWNPIGILIWGSFNRPSGFRENCEYTNIHLNGLHLRMGFWMAFKIPNWEWPSIFFKLGKITITHTAGFDQECLFSIWSFIESYIITQLHSQIQTLNYSKLIYFSLRTVNSFTERMLNSISNSEWRNKIKTTA